MRLSVIRLAVPGHIHFFAFRDICRCSGKEPALLPRTGRNVDQTREGGGNRAYSRHQHWHFVSLCSETRDVAARVSGHKWVQGTELDIVKRSFCNLCMLAVGLALHIFATQCWRAPIRAKQLSTVAILLYRLLSCWCLETFFMWYQPCIHYLYYGFNVNISFTFQAVKNLYAHNTLESIFWAVCIFFCDF